MKIQHLHDWDLTPKEAIAKQKELASRLIDDTPLDLSTIRHVAGVDVSVKNGESQAAVVVITYPELEPVEIVRAKQATSYPYIPGLLTFREGPVLEEAFRKLTIEPDVFVFDGMGQIHPRHIGIAAHLGLWLDKPTIGCGKTHFIGDYDAPDLKKGDYSALTYKGQPLGVVLRTRAKVKPVYISVGHRADIDSAIKLIMSVTPKYRLPRPIRLAHNAAGEFKQET
ncbi:MAG: endonuclease V [Anaerolineae bacterium]|nr:endonuclease V [Anaerolineae bacterium]